MKTCTVCNSQHTDQASYCMHCGMPLQNARDPGAENEGNYQILLWSIVISLLISMVLFKVFHLPVFFIAGFIPLWWQLGKKKVAKDKKIKDIARK